MTKRFDRKQQSLKNIAAVVAAQLVQRGENAMPDTAIDAAERELSRRAWFRKERPQDRRPQILAVSLWAWNCHLSRMTHREWCELDFSRGLSGEVSFWMDVVNE